MKIKYKTVDTRSKKGLRKLEALQRKGWKIGSVGFYTIQFYKEVAKCK